MSAEQNESYGLGKLSPADQVAAPELPYKPSTPKSRNHVFGLIGCGGITQHHLTAYRNAGFQVAAFCDREKARAEKMRDTFNPQATVCDDYRELLRRDDITVVDIATHPQQRVEIIEAALNAGKHVLSQKPFVLDLDTGERLASLADEMGVRLAVNQNGRWAPHFAWMNAAIREGLVGEVTAVSFQLNWDHTWIAGTEFEKVHHIMLYDFAIHWFDMASQFLVGRDATRVQASVVHAAGQTVQPPLVACATVEYPKAMAQFLFNGSSAFGASDRTLVTGTLGTLLSIGRDLNSQSITLYRKEGVSQPQLQGSWFPDGFQGAMAELLCAVEDDREPTNSARNNLRSLALAFAAIRSADTGCPVNPGEVRRLDETDLNDRDPNKI
jgi:predicted dehydrogenase